MISIAIEENGTPTSSSVTPIRPPSCAMRRRSAAQASTHPPPIACAFIAATTGFGQVAPADHHVLAASGDGNIPSFVHHAQITSVHPACAIDGLDGVGGVPITPHYQV